MVDQVQESERWLEAHRGETVVVKLGGSAMVNERLTESFATDIVSLQRAGLRPVVTHGGGPQISAELAAAGIHSEFRGGLRFTTDDAVRVVRDVLVRLGGELVDHVKDAGGSATAIAGDVSDTFLARRIGTVVDAKTVELGRVGAVTQVDSRAVRDVLDAGGIPVVSAIATDEVGTIGEERSLLNINADSAAASLAVALGADRLVLLTDVAGLYRNWPEREGLIGQIGTGEVTDLLLRMESGMIPKVAACRDAVEGGVLTASIIDGRAPHALVAAPFGASGTTVTVAGGVAL